MGVLPRVVPFDLRLDRLAAGVAPVVEGVEIPVFRRIGHGDGLDVGLLEQGPQVGASLPSRAHQGDVDFLAGRNETGAAEHVTGNDRGRRGGGSGSDELTTGSFGIMRALREVDFHYDGRCSGGLSRVDSGT